MTSAILEGLVCHKRHLPIEYNFFHKVFYLLIDLYDLDSLEKIQLFSINKFNFFSLYWNKYGFAPIKDPKKYILTILKDFTLEHNKIKKIMLMTMPKILGYCFNPVSFWLCFDQEGKLLVVFAEVNNTFGERHGYLCFHQNFKAIENGDFFTKDKVLHVSPFCNVSGEYEFKFLLDEKNVNISIDYYKDNKPLITTAIKVRKKVLNDINLLKNFLNYSIAVLRVMFLIHYHAFWLWIKKVPYITKPSKGKPDIT